MARHAAATLEVTRGTFLLEVALDRARLKARLAEALLRERTRRGGGEARRFPQPKMAAELGYSLRQYQRLEDPNEPGIPNWDDLERIVERLGINPAEIFDDATDEPPTHPGDEDDDPQMQILRALEALRESARESQALQSRLEERFDDLLQQLGADRDPPAADREVG